MGQQVTPGDSSDGDFNGAPDLAALQESESWEGVDVLDGMHGSEARTRGEGRDAPPDAIRHSQLETWKAEILERLEISRPGLAARDDSRRVSPVIGAGRADDAPDELDTMQALEMQLSCVDRALARLESGEYGACLSCGSSLSVDLLDEQPERELCPICDSKEGIRESRSL